MTDKGIAPSVARMVADEPIECVASKVAVVFRRWRVQVSIASFVYYDHRHWTKRSAKRAVIGQAEKLAGALGTLSAS